MHTRYILFRKLSNDIQAYKVFKNCPMLRTCVEDRSFMRDINVKRYVHRIYSSENRRRTDKERLIDSDDRTADKTEEYIRYTYKCCDRPSDIEFPLSKHRVVSS